MMRRRWTRFCDEEPAIPIKPIIVWFGHSCKLWYATYNEEQGRIHNLDPNAIDACDQSYLCPAKENDVWWSYLPSNDSDGSDDARPAIKVIEDEITEKLRLVFDKYVSEPISAELMEVMREVAYHELIKRIDIGSVKANVVLIDGHDVKMELAKKFNGSISIDTTSDNAAVIKIYESEGSFGLRGRMSLDALSKALFKNSMQLIEVEVRE